ncbi:hypothetical protein [Curtobacterium sp. MCBD17_040]|nr:hypothetical protein [Curtobacterium sp. MCBD17_040]WIB65268.1 hypothetical protein DEI94_17840 [Curtobacterium sp. MCBD17_040]
MFFTADTACELSVSGPATCVSVPDTYEKRVVAVPGEPALVLAYLQ